MSRRSAVAIAGVLGLALGYLAGSPAMGGNLPPVPMDALGVPAFLAPSPRANAIRPISPDRLTPAELAAGIGSPLAGEGAPALTEREGPGPFAPGHTEAGATAARLGEPAPVGSGFRRHRAPVSLFAIVEAAAIRRDVPVHILAGLAEDESSWRTDVIGASGEAGLLQLSEGTAAWFCGLQLLPVDQRLDPEKNADCGAAYLAHIFSIYGSWELAIVGFKAGPATIPERIPSAAWTFAQRTLAKAEAYR